ncbi:uncharacterized protein LOC114943354 [Nylanderia fulva]|uniref:uncharacterized protein LOC114943354 n=1 Tax=Nylanderia fulva TaxID=613905 RepID=UPI0010FB7E09|nr:uncharacterized protein LOC114943354 [Nylanderia fulva]
MGMFFGDFKCKTEANNKLVQHLQNSTKHKLLPWWKEWTYCNGFMIINEKIIWQSVYDVGLNKSDTKFLEYLACSENTDVINNYLDNLIYYYQYNYRKNYQYLFNSLFYINIITKHAKNQITLQYILNNFQKIKPSSDMIPAVFIIIINNVYFVNQTELIKEYVETWYTTFAGTFHKMNNTEDLLKRHQLKDSIIENLDKIKSKVLIRKKQIKRETQTHWWM